MKQFLHLSLVIALSNVSLLMGMMGSAEKHRSLMVTAAERAAFLQTLSEEGKKAESSNDIKLIFSAILKEEQQCWMSILEPSLQDNKSHVIRTKLKILASLVQLKVEHISDPKLSIQLFNLFKQFPEDKLCEEKYQVISEIRTQLINRVNKYFDIVLTAPKEKWIAFFSKSFYAWDVAIKKPVLRVFAQKLLPRISELDEKDIIFIDLFIETATPFFRQKTQQDTPSAECKTLDALEKKQIDIKRMHSNALRGSLGRKMGQATSEEFDTAANKPSLGKSTPPPLPVRDDLAKNTSPTPKLGFKPPIPARSISLTNLKAGRPLPQPKTPPHAKQPAGSASMRATNDALPEESFIENSMDSVKLPPTFDELLVISKPDFPDHSNQFGAAGLSTTYSALIALSWLEEKECELRKEQITTFNDLLHRAKAFLQEALSKEKDRLNCEIDPSSGCRLIHVCAENNSAALEMLLNMGIEVDGRNKNEETALYVAASQGDCRSIKTLLKHGAAINAQAHNGRTALFAAVQSERKEAVALLLDSGSEVQIRDKNCCTALHVALSKGYHGIVKLLTDRGAQGDAVAHLTSDARANLFISSWADGSRDKQWLLLELAGSRKFFQQPEIALEVIISLLDSGADINMADPDNGDHLIYTAIEVGDKELLDICMTRRADLSCTNTDNDTPLLLAVRKDDFESAELLIKAGAEVNARHKNGSTPLHWACFNGRISLVELLIERGAEIDGPSSKPDTPLNLAAWKGHSEIVDILLAAGASMRVRDHANRTPLHTAMDFKKLEVASQLIARSSAIDVNACNKDGYTPLHLACSNGCTSLVKSLIERGAEIDKPSSKPDTALNLAVWKRHSEIVGMLLAAGASVKVRDHANRIPLHTAIYFSSPEILSQLIAVGSDLNALDSNGLAPLHAVATAGKKEMVDMLIAAGSDIMCKHQDGSTLLHMATQSGLVELTRMLLAKGFDVNAISEYGVTPLHRAAIGGNVEVIKMLLAAGAARHIRTKTTAGNTPLHCAAIRGRSKAVEALLALGTSSDLQEKNELLWTPLHSVAHGLHKVSQDIGADRVVEGLSCEECAETAKILLAAGSDSNALDRKGNKPADLATREAHSAVKKVFAA